VSVEQLCSHGHARAQWCCPPWGPAPPHHVLARELTGSFGHPPLCCSQCCILLAVCLARGNHVIIKQYIKSRMSTRADHKMKREVGRHRKTAGQLGGSPADRKQVAACC
jgi:hypothetical protein